MQEVVITEEYHGYRLDKALAALTNISRHHIAMLINDKKVLDSDYKTITKASLPVKTDMLFKILPVESVVKKSNICVPDIKIVYEDEYILIADKPHGQPSHPSAGHLTNTLLDAAIVYFQKNHITLNTFNGQPALINRLDMDTSGLILIAKDDSTHNHIKQQFSDRSTVKMYKAQVHNYENVPEYFCLEGYVGSSHTQKELRQTYDAKMYKSTPQMYADLQHALQSKWSEKLTEIVNKNIFEIYTDNDKIFTDHLYHTYAQSAYKYAFMECIKSHSIDQKDTLICLPHTGRQHQIRVQLLQANAPIIGDPLYTKDNFHPLRLRSVFINFFHPQKRFFLSIYNP